MVFPKPEELRRRSAERFREMGKEVPADAVNKMLGPLTIFASTEVSPYTYYKNISLQIVNHFSFLLLTAGTIVIMTANYILPTSKDIPGSGEYFDEVVILAPIVAIKDLCASAM